MIYAKCGRLGHGKTMRMAVDGLALQALRQRRRECWVVSNIKINAPADVRFVQLSTGDEFSHDLADLMYEATRADAGLVVLIDEVDEVWGSTDWQYVSKGDRHQIKQSRHYGADLILTSQFIDQIEKTVRNVTEEVELLQAYPRPTLARFEAGKRPWVIRGQRFRPAAVREIMATPEKDKRIGVTWHRYRREHEQLYDTREIVRPVFAEALCRKHLAELKQDRCPKCHPPELRPMPEPIDQLVTLASSTPALVPLHRAGRAVNPVPASGPGGAPVHGVPGRLDGSRVDGPSGWSEASGFAVPDEGGAAVPGAGLASYIDRLNRERADQA